MENLPVFSTIDTSKGKWCRLFNHQGDELLIFEWNGLSKLFAQLYVNHPKWSRAELFEDGIHVGNFDYTEL